MLVVAHRGASGYAPENTFAAFDLARELGATGIETDVRATRDGALVLLHDETVDRTTGGSGPIADLSWAEVAQLDAGSWYAPEFAAQRIPRLEEVINRYLGDLVLCLELKADEAGEPLVRLLRARNLVGDPLLQLITFSWEGLLLLRRALPVLSLGYLVQETGRDDIELLAETGIQWLFPHARAITPQLVGMAHERGVLVGAWGISSLDDLQRVNAAEVDSVTLDYPDWVRPSR